MTNSKKMEDDLKKKKKKKEDDLKKMKKKMKTINQNQPNWL